MTDGPLLFLDCETFSETPLKQGTHRYAVDPSAEVMLITWALDDPLWGEGEVGCWDLTEGGEMPKELADALSDQSIPIIGANFGNFDRVVFRAVMDLDIAPERIIDTMVMALSHGLPGSLDKLCEIFKVPIDLAKNKSGKALIRLFCIPAPKNQKLRRRTKHTHPAEWIEFKEYAKSDISSMRYLYKKMPSWNYPGKPTGNALAPERALWCLDQRINDRGFRVDVELAERAIEAVGEAQSGFRTETIRLTDGEVISPMQRDALLKHLLDAFGVTLPDMTSSTLERRINDPDLPEPVRELLIIRQAASTTSTTKFKALLKSVSPDDRLRGTMQFAGASRTGRWSGRLFQPQNLMRPTMKPGQIADAIDWIKNGTLDLMTDDPMLALSNVMRGAIVAAPGRKLVQADLAQIEARVLPWLAGERWKLEAFKAFDTGEGPDLYTVGAGVILGKPADAVTKDERQAQGKVPELACLGPNTRVLTNHGIKTITEVTTRDLLWDGVEWVGHQGCISKGRKLTLKVDGVEMTPDHQVLAGSLWQSAQTVASCLSTLQCSLESGMASLSSYTKSEVLWEGFGLSWSNATAEPNRTKFFPKIFAKGGQSDASLALGRSRPTPGRSGGVTLPLYLTTTTGDGYVAGYRLASTAAITRMTRVMKAMAPEAFTYGRRGARIGQSFWRIWSVFRGGIARSLSSIEKTTIGGTNLGTYVSLPNVETATTNEQSERWSDASLNWRDTYDIAHAGPRHRFTILSDSGALIVHNCGYGGAVGAFHSMAKIYGLELPDAEAKRIVDLWRKKNPAIADWNEGFWSQLDKAARQAIENPGTTTKAGEHIRFHRQGEWLRMRLPSGRLLVYARPKIVEDPRWENKTAISYFGMNNYTRKWERLYTYGGKLSADATQATARDIMAANLPAIEEAGFPITILVHDECLTEPLDRPEYSSERLIALLSRRPEWADDSLPIAADGWEGDRYHK